MKKTTKKTATKKSVKNSAPAVRVNKADTKLKSEKEFIALCNKHDGRPLTTHERAYDNQILRNNLDVLTAKTHVNLKIDDVKLDKDYGNKPINRDKMSSFMNQHGVKKGSVVLFSARNDDTKTGDVAKCATFATQNRLSKLKGLETKKLFIFYVK